MPNYFIKLSGKFNINEPLVRGEDYVLALEVNAKQKTEEDAEQNGELDITFKCPVIRGEIATRLGKKIKFEKKSSHSALLNGQLRMIALERQLDPEKFYHETMVALRHNTLAVLDFLDGLKNH